MTRRVSIPTPSGKSTQVTAGIRYILGEEVPDGVTILKRSHDLEVLETLRRRVMKKSHDKRCTFVYDLETRQKVSGYPEEVSEPLEGTHWEETEPGTWMWGERARIRKLAPRGKTFYHLAVPPNSVRFTTFDTLKKAKEAFNGTRSRVQD